MFLGARGLRTKTKTKTFDLEAILDMFGPGDFHLILPEFWVPGLDFFFPPNLAVCLELLLSAPPREF